MSLLEYPIIGYENLLTEGTVVGSDTNPENAYDWLAYDSWETSATGGNLALTLGSAQSADYFAFHGHDLDEVAGAGQIKLQYDPGGGLTDIPETIITPSDGRTTLVTFGARSSTSWKVIVSGNTAAANIALIAFGTRLDLEQKFWTGFEPVVMARKDVIQPVTSEGGNQLGRSLIRTGISGTIPLSHLSPSWVRDNLDDFLIHQQTKGFFLQWKPDLYPDEVAWCWTDNTPRPMNMSPKKMSADITFQGLTE
jgi:hypothetical protein